MPTAQTLGYVLVHAVTAIFTASLGVWIVTQTRLVAKRWLGTYLALVTAWSAVRAVQLLVTGETIQRVFFHLDIGLAPLAVVLSVAFASAYTGKPVRENPLVYVFALVCVGLSLAAVTNWSHGWYASPTVFETPVPHVARGEGTGRSIAVLTALVGNLVVIYYFVSLYLRSRQRVSVPLLVFALAWALSFSPLVAQEAGLLSIDTYDYTPFGIGFIALAIAYASFRYDLDDRAVIARDEVVEQLDDPYLAIDTDRKLIDSNGKTTDLIGMSTDELYGKSLADIWPELDEATTDIRELETTEAEIEIPLSDGETTRYFDLNVSPVWDPRGERRGWLLILREITQLKEREFELQLIRQVQSRVLRHNMRNDLTVIRTYGEQIADETAGQHADIASTIVSKADHLSTLSDKVRDIRMLTDRDLDTKRFDIVPRVTRAVQTVSKSFPDAEITVEAPPSCYVRTTPEIELAIENIVENAVEHNDSETPAVDVSVSTHNGQAEICVSDNGPGIPEAELKPVTQREETQLSHGTGVGLWIVEWLVDGSNVGVEYETSPTGTDVTLSVPTAESAHL